MWGSNGKEKRAGFQIFVPGSKIKAVMSRNKEKQRLGDPRKARYPQMGTAEHTKL